MLLVIRAKLLLWSSLIIQQITVLRYILFLSTDTAVHFMDLPATITMVLFVYTTSTSNFNLTQLK